MNTEGLDAVVDLQFLDPNDERWADYIATNPQANIFHHPAWSYLLAETYGYEPFVLAAFNSQGIIHGAVPLVKIRSLFNKGRLASLPFTDHCSPLYSNQFALQCLTNHLVSLSKNGEISRIDLHSDYPALPGRCRYSDYVLHRLRLAPEASEVSNRIKRKHFRQVRVAENRGVRIEKGYEEDFVRQFYHLHTLTRRRKGIPVQPWRFFELLVHHITRQELGFILLAFKENECVAGAVFLNWNRTLIYKYSASVEIARQLLAMDLLLWTAICWGCNHGYSWMDMGRTSNDDDGLKYFKRRWGANEFPLNYCLISEGVQKQDHSSWLRIAQPIIQRAPLWVCRAAGEFLYGHFG